MPQAESYEIRLPGRQPIVLMSTVHWSCSISGLHEFNATKTTLVARQLFARLSMQVQWILLGPKRAFAGEFMVARKVSKAVSQGSATPLRMDENPIPPPDQW
jgi:hypothetical protein